MAEIPWANVALCELMTAGRAHPEWGMADMAWIAADAEEQAIRRGSEIVYERDVRAAVAAYKPAA